jgi:hypothetical protein
LRFLIIGSQARQAGAASRITFGVGDVLGLAGSQGSAGAVGGSGT